MEKKPPQPETIDSTTFSDEQLEKTMAKVSWGDDGKFFVVGSGTLFLIPQVQARLMKPITGEVPSLGHRIKKEMMILKQKADQGDEEAVRVIYDVATCGVIVLDSLHKIEIVRSVAKNKSIWPVMGSADDTMIKRNNETFKKIGLGGKMETPSIPSLLKHESGELLWAGAIKTEIERIRNFVSKLLPETKAELFGKADPVWPCTIVNQNILLKTEIIIECEKLPALVGDDESMNAWWNLLEEIFEIATDGKWENIPELRKTHQRAAKGSGANPENYIRSNIKSKLKNKFVTRLCPPKKPAVDKSIQPK